MLGRALEDAGFSVAWPTSTSDLAGCPELRQAALKGAGCVVVLLSRASVEAVEAQARDAMRRKIAVPVLLEPEAEISQALDLSDRASQDLKTFFIRLLDHDAVEQGGEPEPADLSTFFSDVAPGEAAASRKPLGKQRAFRSLIRRIERVLAPALTFEQVFAEELDWLGDRAEEPSSKNVYARAHASQLSGLAFSGGGIRSATFHLGVLQALAGLGLLRCFDYLSTVSGGGYIGSWLVAWIRRRGLMAVEKGLEREIPRRRKDEAIPTGEEWSPITFLRHFSNYLTPRTGLLSLDTWTAVATYSRNLMLNLSILVLALSAFLLLPRLLVEFAPVVPLDLWLALGAVAASVALVATAWAWSVEQWSRASRKQREGKEQEEQEEGSASGVTDRLADAAESAMRALATTASRVRETLEEAHRKDRFRSPGWVVTLVVMPVFAAAAAIALWLPSLGAGGLTGGLWQGWARIVSLLPLDWTTSSYARWTLGIAGIYLLFWVVATLGPRALTALGGSERSARRGGDAEEPLQLPWVLGAAPVAGACGGAALAWLARRLAAPACPVDWVGVITWGPPAVILVFMLTAIVHLGLTGRGFLESHRQWWSRLGGWFLILALGWAGTFFIALYGPPLLGYLGDRARGALSLGWLAATAAGILAGRSPTTGGRFSRRSIEAVALVAPYVFMLGLLMALSLAIQEIAVRISGDPVWQPAAAAGEKLSFTGWVEASKASSEALAQGHPLLLPLLFAFTAAAAAFLSWRVDINEFSMHHFYRNRLIRAYLGASRVGRRRPIQFTGFDPGDDLLLHDLREGPRRSEERSPREGPIQILNTTLNLTTGEELAWQERKATSFFFTPFHFGFDPRRFGSRLEGRGFRRTPEDERFSLGTALAISGAAVNPNMGYHSSTALAFLMTVFNTRLGWWLRNPSRPGWHRPGPRLGLRLLLSELFGSTGAGSNYINLADGGFFDNLGIYELVRRRCRFILACDAEADPQYRFAALGTAIRRCRSDFGVDIEIQLDPIRRQAATGYSRWHCAVGKIHYHTDDKAPTGTLVYLKASLSGDEPEDLLNYAAQRAGFPHESTADQWFGEAQFESYRTLGWHEAGEVLGGAVEDARGQSEKPESRLNPESVFVALRHAWYPPSSATAGSFTRHTEKLVEVFEQLRSDARLAFLDEDLFLELRDWKSSRELPEEPRQAPESPQTWSEDTLRAAFYLCSSLIQLMENVYVDLALEREWRHPDNRGWLNLFRHWSYSPWFRKTWAVSAGTYGARFQTFCRQRLDLSLGRVGIRPCTDFRSLADAHAELTTLEKELLVQLDEQRRDEGAWWGPPTEGRKGWLLILLEMVVDEELEFPFGFAVLVQDGQDRQRLKLKYFRVRNHLRALGLGRVAMKALIEDQMETLITDPRLRGDDLVTGDLYSPGRRQYVKSLFHSALNELRRSRLPDAAGV